MGGNLESAKNSVYAGLGTAVAAARSTELQPIHFIHLIAVAVSNRGANLLGGMRKHYSIVVFGKPKLRCHLQIRLRVSTSYPRQACDRSMTTM